ncbi:MAG: hypothetical protein HYV26_13615 [Candidatus Hydrogenedentes bacterium]|nr:hypothetical protein [Candidatus Hydrogenedentota bacterium]
MRLQRFLAAVAALGLLTALNLLVWRQDFFSLPVLVAVAAAVVASGGWAVAALVDLASRQAAGPRAAGALSAVLSSAIFLCICLVVYALIESWGYSADLTEEGRRTLAPQTVQVLQALTEEVQVKCIFLQIDDELIRIAIRRWTGRNWRR